MMNILVEKKGKLLKQVLNTEKYQNFFHTQKKKNPPTNRQFKLLT